MQTDPGKKDPAEDQKKQANKQKLIDNLLNQIKILNNTLTSRSIALWIINIAKRLSSKDYQRKLKEFILEKILRRRRGRGQALVDTATAEVLEQRKKKEEQVPTMLKKDPETPPLLFSQQSQNKTLAKVSPKGPEETISKRRWWPSPFKRN